ncbi:MAG: hypothetical protein OEU36_04070, partial [Gammaproteobacteria bacterium]|nr:hypothetical protein [Gammaproteobacteria bacterium]
MRRFLLASSLLIIFGSSFAESTVTVPWTEFRGLYAEQIKRKLEGTKTDDELPPLYTIEQAFYQLTVTDKGAAGRVQVAGRVLQGEPDPLPLFGHDIAVNDVKELSGGRLIANEQGYDLFVGDEKAFRVVLDVSVPMRREELSRYIEFSVPRSVQNVLELSLPSSLRLSAAGAMQQTDGRYYFSPTDALTLRFEDLVQSKAGELSLDSFTQFELQGGRLVATHFFVPTQSVNVPVQISLDPSGGGFGTSLSTEWIESRGDEKIIATLPSNWLEPFIIQQEFSVSTDAIDFRLPSIEGNAGQEGNIQIKQAVDARIQMLNPQLTQAIPAQQLSAGVRAYASVSDTYSQVPIGPEGDGRRVQIQVEWLEAVSTPEIVLDAVHFHTSFADNGDALTALHLNTAS